MTKLAKIFSYILHPAFMPLIGIYIIFHSGIYETDVPWEFEKYTYLIVALFSILLPFSILPIFVYWKIISNLELSDRKERIIPLSITSLCLVMLHIFIARIIPIRIITSFTFSVAAISILLFGINMFAKISMHLLGIGGITGLIIALTFEYNIHPFFWLAIVILIAGIAATSRLILKAHTVFQVSIGYALGLIATLFLISSFFQ